MNIRKEESKDYKEVFKLIKNALKDVTGIVEYPKEFHE